MATPVFDKIKQWLDERGVSYRTVHHEPTYTSEESARARGEEIKIGGKAILMKVGEIFKLFVLSADRKIDSDLIKAEFGIKKTRFATAEELQDFTGLVPGSVPPFGFPILPFELYIDQSILLNPRIAFNAGSLTDSIVMAVPDYIAVADGRVFAFSRVD